MRDAPCLVDACRGDVGSGPAARANSGFGTDSLVGGSSDSLLTASAVLIGRGSNASWDTTYTGSLSQLPPTALGGLWSTPASPRAPPSTLPSSLKSPTQDGPKRSSKPKRVSILPLGQPSEAGSFKLGRPWPPISTAFRNNPSDPGMTGGQPGSPGLPKPLPALHMPQDPASPEALQVGAAQACLWS